MSNFSISLDVFNCVSLTATILHGLLFFWDIFEVDDLEISYKEYSLLFKYVTFIDRLLWKKYEHLE